MYYSIVSNAWVWPLVITLGWAIVALTQACTLTIARSFLYRAALDHPPRSQTSTTASVRCNPNPSLGYTHTYTHTHAHLPRGRTAQTFLAMPRVPDGGVSSLHGEGRTTDGVLLRTHTKYVYSSANLAETKELFIARNCVTKNSSRRN